MVFTLQRSVKSKVPTKTIDLYELSFITQKITLVQIKLKVFMSHSTEQAAKNHANE